MFAFALHHSIAMSLVLIVALLIGNGCRYDSNALDEIGSAAEADVENKKGGLLLHLSVISITIISMDQTGKNVCIITHNTQIIQ